MLECITFKLIGVLRNLMKREFKNYKERLRENKIKKKNKMKIHLKLLVKTIIVIQTIRIKIIKQNNSNNNNK